MKPFLVVALGFLTAFASASVPSTPAVAHLALLGVTVVDVESGRLLPNQTVLVGANRILAVQPAGAMPPAGAQVVEVRGKYLIPGLWDMHVHLFHNTFTPGTDVHDTAFPLFLANGVTGVRDMWTDLDDIAQVGHWNREAASGLLLAPRILAGGPLLDGTPPIWPNALVVTRADDAPALLDSLIRGGANVIKVYSRLPRDVYFALTREAKRRGIEVVGHVPASILAAEASDAGQRSIEHLQVTDDCSTVPDEISQMRSVSTRQGDPRVLARLLETYSDSLCARLFERFVRNGTWQVPTLVVLRQAALRGDSVFLNTARRDLRLRYVQNDQREQWEGQAIQAVSRANAEQVDLSRRALRNRLHIVGGMHRAGVQLLAGSDVGNPFLVAGFSLHDELELLVDAGLTPLAAIQAATIGPARYLNATDSLGTVASGKLADLVLLDGNPLTDIRNTRRIHAVVVNGRLADRQSLDALLREVEAALRGPTRR